jgi:uncharacterized membrane protein
MPVGAGTCAFLPLHQEKARTLPSQDPPCLLLNPVAKAYRWLQRVACTLIQGPHLATVQQMTESLADGLKPQQNPEQRPACFSPAIVAFHSAVRAGIEGDQAAIDLERICSYICSYTTLQLVIHSEI